MPQGTGCDDGEENNCLSTEESPTESGRKRKRVIDDILHQIKDRNRITSELVDVVKNLFSAPADQSLQNQTTLFTFRLVSEMNALKK